MQTKNEELRLLLKVKLKVVLSAANEASVEANRLSINTIYNSTI